MQENISLLFALLRASIGAGALSDAERDAFCEERLPALFKIAKKHDVGHLLAKALLETDLLPDKHRAGAERTIALAVYRYEQLRHELERASAALEVAGLAFIPLKGSVLRAYYPEPWMRTSCDIDILVKEPDLDAAIAALTEACGYTCGAKSAHDVSLLSEGGVHIELHYDLVEEGRAAGSAAVLADTWDLVTPYTGCEFRMVMPDELFYFYHIAHMAKHFEVGGCGIRPFLDLLLLEARPDSDKAARDAMLSRGGLLRFAEAARRLARVWFCGEETDDDTEQLSDFILCGGVYGSQKNRVTVQSNKSGGRAKYLLSKIFLPYKKLKFHYPILQKHRWLTPFMEVRRWFRLLFGGHAKRAAAEIRYNQNLAADDAQKTRHMLDYLGL